MAVTYTVVVKCSFEVPGDELSDAAAAGAEQTIRDLIAPLPYAPMVDEVFSYTWSRFALARAQEAILIPSPADISLTRSPDRDGG